MSEIERIQKAWDKEDMTGPCHYCTAKKDIQVLLSSLEVRDNEIKALEGLRMSLRCEIEEIKKKYLNECTCRKDEYGQLKELKAELEKEKEQSDYFRLEVNRLTDELAKEKEENGRLNRVYNLELERVNKAENQHFSSFFKLAKAKERVVQLEKAIDEWTKLYHSLQEHRVHNI